MWILFPWPTGTWIRARLEVAHPLPHVPRGLKCSLGTPAITVPDARSLPSDQGFATVTVSAERVASV